MTTFLIRLFIKNSNDVKKPCVRENYGKMGGIVGIFCNLLLFGFKLFVGLITGSLAVLADAFNNLSDIGSSVITILGFKLASKPADSEHPFGHGRMEYMSGAMVAVLIILVGIELVKGSLNKISNPTPIDSSILAIIILAVSIGIKFWMYLFNKRLGNAVSSSALIATSRDSLNDCIATSAVLISVIISTFSGINIDPYAGLLVACFIIFSGVKTIKETLDPLLGMPPDPEMIDEIKSIVFSHNDFHGIHDMIVHNYGPGRTFATLHVEVPLDIDILHCHEEIDLCERELKHQLGIEVVIHMDPVSTDDEEVIAARRDLMLAIHAINDSLAIHDFRMVKGEKRTNLIFDIVTPIGFNLSDSDLKCKISQNASAINPSFCCVITVDRNYI